MQSKSATFLFIATLGIFGWTSPRASADAFNQRVTFTFSAPVEIPGQALPAGTYVFKLVDSMSDRNIVQVFSPDQKHLYGTFLTIPDEHLRPSSKAIITFDEAPAGAPQAVKAWFYPGDTFGHDFVYPKPKAMALAKANNTPVPSMPAELAANTVKPAVTLAEPHVVALRQAPLKAQMPNEQEVEVSQVFVSQAAPSPAPASLPTTASDLPLMGLTGLLALGIAGLLTVVLSKAE